jgi:phosphoglucosamine mutase
MKYFGTDGMRGTYGVAPIDGVHLRRLSCALGKKYNPLRRVAIGRDTRASGVEIKNFLTECFAPATEILDCGVVTSPLLSRAVVDTGANLGLMITASHNPACDNGVKILNNFGEKITIKEEVDLEQLMDFFSNPVENCDHPTVSYDVQPNYEMAHDFFNLLPHVAIDCANGAAVNFAKKIYHFNRIDWLGDQPNGQNINEYCGSEHPELLCQNVLKNHANLGIAHDGDGDRLLLCDRNGVVLPGEIILGVIAIFLEKTNKLQKHRLVTTAMSNEGLRLSLGRYGIRVIDAEVGDRRVAEKMRELGCNFGGESSGHVLFFDKTPTSDGIQAALLFLKAIAFLKISPEDTHQLIKLLPQKSCNISIGKKVPLEEFSTLRAIIEKERERIGSRGKIFIRYSGTEPKLRLLVEAESENLAENIMSILKSNIEKCNEIL